MTPFNPAGHHINPTYRSSHAPAQNDPTTEQGEKILATIRRQQQRERAEYAAEHYRDSAEPWKKIMIEQYKNGQRADFPAGHADTHSKVTRDANGRIA